MQHRSTQTYRRLGEKQRARLLLDSAEAENDTCSKLSNYLGTTKTEIHFSFIPTHKNRKVMKVMADTVFTHSL